MDKDFLCSFENISLTDDQARDYILQLSESYREKKKENELYSVSNHIPENIIQLYLYYVFKTQYDIIVENYKNKFVLNESLVEPGVPKDEKIGLGRIYDYIKGFDYEKDHFDIFVTSLKLHCMLYSACPFPEYGGKIRDNTAVLRDSLIEVLPPEDAGRQFQSYIGKRIPLSLENPFEYIDECIKTTVDLIRIQPFPDGNKRTFRALLNIMLSKLKIPPVYIEVDERAEYKKQLLKALIEYDYEGITRFYYYKICDAIVYLDITEKKEDTIAKRKR